MGWLICWCNGTGSVSSLARAHRLSQFALFALRAAADFHAAVVRAGKSPVRWPPYMPPYIAVLNDWMKPEEIVASDMPWAVAWYADRRGLWLPDTIKTLTDLSDYNILGGPMNGLYLTPISGTRTMLARHCERRIPRLGGCHSTNMQLENFPLKWGTALGLDNECLFLSDHDREHARAMNALSVARKYAG